MSKPVSFNSLYFSSLCSFNRYLDFLDCINPFKLIEICCGDVKKTGFAGEGIFGKLAFCSISMAGPKDSIGEIAAALFQTGPS